MSIFTDSGISSKINQNRLIARQSHGELSSLYFNKPVQLIEKISQNYLSHFSSDFLFFQGDPVKIYQTVDTGILYYFDILFVCAGVYYFIKNGNLFKPILIGLLIIGPIAGGLTRYVPSASRTLLFAVPLIMLSAIGISGLSKLRKKNNLYFILFVCLIFCIVSNMSLYLYRYYVITPVAYAKEWHYGTKDVLSYVSDHQNQYDRIWFSKNVWGYIYALFYLKYPPGIYQQKDHLGLLNEYGFGWVENFDKYYFDMLPQNMKTVKSTLFIGTPEEFPADIKPLKIIYYPDNSSAFYIADRNSFLK